MSPTFWSGLLAGIEGRMSPSEEALLKGGFAEYRAEHFGFTVRDAGGQVFSAMSAEQSCSDAVRFEYQSKLLELLRGAIEGGSPPACCCDHHRALFPELSSAIAAGEPTWLKTFFEILTALTENLHFQFESPIGVEEGRSFELSRLMTLEAFVRHHADDDFSESARDRFIDRLAPHYSRRARKNARDHRDLGSWHGTIGTYSSPTPATLPAIIPYARDCPSVKPFSTLTYELEKRFERDEPPDSLLSALGMTFKPNSFYIELIFCTQHVRFYRPADHHNFVAIPTCIEAAGNWAFRPDRDEPPVTNYALDIGSDGRGLPEIIHQPIACATIDDAIVWPSPTMGNWADRSPFSAGRA
jgi:hypothetical protein